MRARTAAANAASGYKGLTLQSVHSFQSNNFNCLAEMLHHVGSICERLELVIDGLPVCGCFWREIETNAPQEAMASAFRNFLQGLAGAAGIDGDFMGSDLDWP